MKRNSTIAAVGLWVGVAGCSDILNFGGPDNSFPREPSVSDGSNSGGGSFVSPPERMPAEPVQAAKPPPAITGGTLAISPGEKFAVAADTDRDLVHVVTLSNKSIRSIEMGEGSEPGRVAVDASEHAHIVLRGTGELAQIDLTAGTIVTRASVCEHPRGVSLNEGGATLLVACASGDVVSLNAATYEERARKFLDHDLRDVVVTKDKRILVSRYRKAEVIEINAALEEVGRVRAARRVGTGFSLETGSPEVRTMEPTLAWRTVLNQDGEAVMLHQRSQIEEVRAEPGGYGGSGCGGITEAAISVMSEGSTPVATGALSGAVSPVDISFSPNGKWVAFATPSAYLNGNSSTLTLFSAPAASVATTPPPSDPDAGIAPIECGGNFSQAFGDFDTQVTAVAFGARDLLYAFSREPASLDIYRLDAPTQPDDFGWASLTLQTRLPLSSVSMRDSGHDLFHADVGSGIACVSCHGEALDDGHVWSFGGIGPRRTQTMRGGLSGTEPFHWDGDMQNFGHLVDEVMTGRMGGFAVEDPFKKAMMSWIDAQPAVKLSARDVKAVGRGEKLFKSAGCGGCHAGPALTNNVSVDVGTGGVFQVPSLRGLALRAPYMHDGCAKTLAERFKPNCGGGDRHGTTSKLDATQIRDLTAYLETL